jgi:sugar lactone lactonase YvrE
VRAISTLCRCAVAALAVLMLGSLCAAPLHAELPGDIDHFAGGSIGDGGAATDAIIDPNGLATDADGNLYIADAANNRIRRVDMLTGNIETVAGTGDYGFGGDNGPAAEALFASPTDVAIDLNGDLLIADRGNNRIRRVDLDTRIITTVAGTGISGYSGDGQSATAARISNPRSVSVGNDNSFYIADTNNHRVRRVRPNGVISTYAGSGVSGFLGDGGEATSARLSLPWDVTMDAAGNLYIADFSNYRVRKVTAVGIISTFAGSGIWGSCGNGGPATSACFRSIVSVEVTSSGFLIIADGSSHNVRSVPLGGGTISSIAGTGVTGYSGDGGPAVEAQLSGPRGLAEHPELGTFVADANNQRIRWIDTGNTIWTYAGNGGVSYGGDGGPAAFAIMNSPLAIATDSQGNLYIADTFNNAIRKVDTRGIITTVAGTGEWGSSGDGGAATNAKMGSPSGVAVDSQGRIYIADTDNDRIRRVSASGTITTFALVSRPAGIAVDGNDNLYVAEQLIHRVKKITPSGSISNFAGTGTRGFSGDGGSATAAALAIPKGIAAFGGNIYIADSGNDRIRKVTANGVISTFAGGGSGGDGGPATQASLRAPFSVATDNFGNVYLVDRGNLRMRVVDTSGTIYSGAGNGVLTGSIDGPGGDPADDLGDGGAAPQATFSDPRGIAVDPAGNAYLSDAVTHTIRRIYDIAALYGGSGSNGAVLGQISYYSNGVPVPSVSVQLQGSEGQTVSTTTSGDYAATDLPSGSWSVVPFRSGGVTRTVVSPLDASYVLQATAGLIALSPEQQLACDVTGNGALSTLDASLILQRALGMSNVFEAATECGSDWLFLPDPAAAPNQTVVDPDLQTGSCQMGAISFNPLSGQPDDQDFLALLLGDCTGNWGNGGAPAALSATRAASPATVVLGPVRSSRRRIRIPVSIHGEGDLSALQLEVRYDSAKMRLTGIRKRGAAESAMIRSIEPTAGMLTVVLAAKEAVALPASAPLVLEFEALERLRSGTGIRSARAQVDERDVSVRLARRRR